VVNCKMCFCLTSKYGGVFRKKKEFNVSETSTYFHSINFYIRRYILTVNYSFLKSEVHNSIILSRIPGVCGSVTSNSTCIRIGYRIY
jgi:hypothetical protein